MENPPQLKEFLNGTNKGIEKQREIVEQLCSHREPQWEGYYESIDTGIAKHIQRSLRTLRMVGLSHKFRSENPAAVAPLIENISLSLSEFSTAFKTYLELREDGTLPVERVFFKRLKKEGQEIVDKPKKAAPVDLYTQMAQDMAEMKELIKLMMAKMGEPLPPKFPNSNNEIQKIQVVRTESDDQYQIIINGQHDLTVSSKKQGSGKLLYDLAESGSNGVNRFDYGDNDPKYWNSVKDNPIYAKTNCSLTSVIKKKGGHYIPGVEIRMIAPDTYKKLRRDAR